MISRSKTIVKNARNTPVKTSQQGGTESDLEEGEIPEFEITSNASEKDRYTRMTGKRLAHVDLLKKNIFLEKFPRSYFRNNSNCFDRNNRCISPPSEGEYISEEEQLIDGKRLLKKDVCGKKLNQMEPIYLHPMQATYGSVEDIMTKIGKTLGRNSNCYYKERRSKETRRLFNLNNNRRIDTIHRECNPISKKNDYYKRRHNESDSGSDSDIWEKKDKLKNKKLLNSRRKRKDFKKKRKKEYVEIVLSDASDSEEHRKPPDQKNFINISNEEPKIKTTLYERLFKEIPLPQERETVVINEAKGKYDADVPANLKGTEEAVFVTNNVDECLMGDNSKDAMETFVNPEDKDEDVELIKLRFLALTSNKKKGQVLVNNIVKESNNSKLILDEKINNISKTESTSDSDKDQDNASVPNIAVNKKSNENDIDRYELLLRAEALRSALLKKHQHKIKKQNRDQNIHGFVPDNEEQLQKNALPAVSEGKLISSDKIMQEDISVQTHRIIEDSTINIDNTCRSGSTVSKDLNIKSESNLEVQTTIGNYSSIHLYPVVSQELASVNCNTENTPRGNQCTKKKNKRRVRKSRRLGDLSLKESNIQLSDRPEEEEEIEKIKLQLLNDLNRKRNIKENEKKFILVDSLQKPNSLLDSSVVIGQNKLPPESKVTDLNTGTERSTGVAVPVAAIKLPAADVERIIVHLGSDSSDEECAFQTNHNRKPVATNEIENHRSPCINNSQSKALDYERSVELLLKEARKKIESCSDISHKVPPTPEAVYNHLAPSQRLEYMRLKQKIAEREKLKKMKAVCNNVPSHGETPDLVQSRDDDNKNFKIQPSPILKQTTVANNLASKDIPDVKSGIVRKDMKNRWQKIVVNNILDSRTVYNNNSGNKVISRNRLINQAKLKKDATVKLNSTVDDRSSQSASTMNSVNMEKSIIEKKKILTQNRLHLERLKMLWKKLKIEKMIEEKYLNEIKKLKAQQNILELKINQQRLKIKKMAEESKQIYEVYQKNNKGMETNVKKKKVIPVQEKILSKVDDATNAGESTSDPQSKTSGIDENPCSMMEISEAHLSEKTLVASTNSEISKEVKEVHEPEGNLTLQADKVELQEYNSPLQSLTAGSETLLCHKVDPNAIMCQYDLLGKCNDEECAYQHLRS